uniref:RIIa domain-containing protein n=1 Tax=Chromera velia CCMP2878 TaxID=1169474 RepID=A0A0G4IDS5_9ALVE|mmetsp:Transcript_22055/g.43767  ORF Transcript_22055/g.43767 Transcript_22055/m.43767 type:complete len:95 (-) Transcript_22055:16-300(-)|eukprot:Cvel_13505.t1-p1 / transcript=Cvel_13505.t1 / gene=Cvel_13505 / organism=Chromera_velia_CCMP2878 / gene_product=RIIa domain-containing protein 1, putative / transcript_product=RIIa domain-containing protein 1, putative / location=Cvel_scaffold925:33739-35630(+) / protein_length=94 / sequence_SO=supercontig / SO=protein_coding / is_pseudo=false
MTDKGQIDEDPVLTEKQQRQLNKTKVLTNVQNEKYLRSHPELKKLVSVFLNETLEHKPDRILEFAGDFFTRPDLRALVDTKTEQLDNALSLLGI